MIQPSAGRLKPETWDERGVGDTVLAAWPYINEAFIFSSAVCIAIGWYFIRRKQVESHRRMMITGSILGGAFFIGYALRTVIVGDTSFGGPIPLRLPYQVFLDIHSFLATVAGVLGIITLRFAFKQAFGKHRKIGPWTATTWFITTGSGLIVFLLLYVVYTPGPTHNLWHTMTAPAGNSTSQQSP